MRWQALFADLEAQLEAAEAAELAGEVADRTRLEQGRVRAAHRLAASVGGSLTLTLPGPTVVRGTLQDVGVDWLLLDEGGGREVLVPAASLLTVSGLGRATAAPEPVTAVAGSLDLRWALRGLARARAGVSLLLVDGSAVVGTLDRVGADHVEVAEHAPGEARRSGAVRGVRLVTLSALAAVRSS